MKPARRREAPYIWVTWLRSLLSGDSSCEWSTWFRAHHYAGSWNKAQSDFDFNAWKQKHTAYMRGVCEEWKAGGYELSIERQNNFKLKGKAAVLAGQPDIVARRGKHGVIIDIKTGKPKSSDEFQVKIYMWAAKRCKPLGRGINKYDGRIEYADGTFRDIPADSIDNLFHDEIVGLIKRIASETPADKVPSAGECAWCDITSDNCPERIDQEDDMSITEDF